MISLETVLYFLGIIIVIILWGFHICKFVKRMVKRIGAAFGEGLMQGMSNHLDKQFTALSNFKKVDKSVKPLKPETKENKNG